MQDMMHEQIDSMYWAFITNLPLVITQAVEKAFHRRARGCWCECSSERVRPTAAR
jgi:hypothetical protein